MLTTVRRRWGWVLSVVVMGTSVAWAGPGDSTSPVSFAPGMNMAQQSPQQAAKPSLTPEAKEAAQFFDKLSKNSDNPLISAWAQESFNRLTTGKPATAEHPAVHHPNRKEVAVSLLTQANNSLAVPAMLNGKTMGTFLVDTGATYTVITPRLAKKLNVQITPETPRISIVTANGVVKAPMVMIDSLMIGSVEVKNVKAIVQPLGDDLLLAGLLGMNFFQGMDLAVRQNKLILSVNTDY